MPMMMIKQMFNVLHGKKVFEKTKNYWKRKGKVKISTTLTSKKCRSRSKNNRHGAEQ
jgi:hypothetical protein